MRVRNWWIEANIDGRKTPLRGGPIGKKGGFSITIMQRDNGEITHPIQIWGVVGKAGNLVLRVVNKTDITLAPPITIETKR